MKHLTCLFTILLLINLDIDLFSKPIQRSGWPQIIGKDGDILHPNNLSVDYLNDHTPIIVVSTHHYIAVYDLNGNILPGWPIYFWDYQVASGPVVGDVDGDNRLDLIAMLRDSGLRFRSLIKLSLEGQVDSTLSIDFYNETQFPITSPVLVNLDEDSLGTKEIIFIADSLYVIYGNGTSFPGFPKPISGRANFTSGIVVGINAPWQVPVIFWSTVDQLHAIRIDKKKELPGWPVGFQKNNFVSNPVLIPREHDWYISIGTSDSLWVFNSKGLDVPGFPIHPYQESHGNFNYLSVGDIDGDEIPDLVFNLMEPELHAISLKDGSYLPNFPFMPTDHASGEPCAIIRRKDIDYALIFKACQMDSIWGNKLIGLNYTDIIPGFPMEFSVENTTASVAIIPPFHDTLHIVFNSNNGFVNVIDLPMDGEDIIVEWQMPGGTPGGNCLYKPRTINVRQTEDTINQQIHFITTKSIYRNPNSNLFEFFISPNFSGELHVAVFNIAGSKIWKRTFPTWAGVSRSISWEAINVAGEKVEPGIYLLQISGVASGLLKAIVFN